jgi:hypothetical protein
MLLRFHGEVIEWRGPAPYHFVQVPPAVADDIREVVSMVSYGWGVVPAEVRVGRTDFHTSLFPRNGGYLLPLKDAVRRAEGIDLGDTVEVSMTLDLSRRRAN